MPPRTPRSRCWTRCRTRRRSACGSTAARCRAGRSARPAGTRSSCSRWAAWTATGAGRAADPLVQRPRANPDRLRARAGGRRPRHERQPHDRARLRRQGHLPAALAVQRRAARSPRAASRCASRRSASTSTPRRSAELECIASAGGGVYREATDAASLREELRILTTRTLRQYVAEGQADQGRPERAPGDADHPGRTPTSCCRTTERWYAIDLKPRRDPEGEPSFIPPDRGLVESGRRGTSALDIVTPDFNVPDMQNSGRGRPPVRAPRLRRRDRRRLAADRRRRAGRRRRSPSPSPAATTSSSSSRTARTRRSSTRPAGSRTRRSWRSRSSAARAASPPRARAAADHAARPPDTPTSRRARPCSPLVGGGLAAAGFAGAGARCRRRRRMRLVAPPLAAALLALPAAAHAQDATPSSAAARSTPRRCSSPARYADTVAAGETVYWKVKLAKGQVLRGARHGRHVADRDRLLRQRLPGPDHLDYNIDILSRCASR